MLEEMGDRPNVACALHVMARIAAAECDYVRSTRLYGAARVLRDFMQIRLPYGERRQEEADHTLLCVALGEPLFQAHFQAGHRLSWTQAVAYALS